MKFNFAPFLKTFVLALICAILFKNFASWTNIEVLIAIWIVMGTMAVLFAIVLISLIQVIALTLIKKDDFDSQKMKDKGVTFILSLIGIVICLIGHVNAITSENLAWYIPNYILCFSGLIYLVVKTIKDPIWMYRRV